MRVDVGMCLRGYFSLCMYVLGIWVEIEFLSVYLLRLGGFLFEVWGGRVLVNIINRSKFFFYEFGFFRVREEE